MLVTANPPASPGPPASVDWTAVARLVVERIAPTPGEQILLVGAPGIEDAIVPALKTAITAAGGVYLGAIAVRGTPPSAWQTPFTERATGMTVDQLVSHFAPVDVAIMLPGAGAVDAPYDAMQRILRSPTAGHRRTIHFHWAGAYSLEGILMNTTPERARVYEQVLLGTDYTKLAGAQRTLERAMRGTTIHVTTPAGTDLRFTIGDRPVTKQDGDASAAQARQARNLIDREVELPAGAIRVAPIEESVTGTIAFPPSVWGGEKVTALVMKFAQGRVVSFEAASGVAGVQKELVDGGEAAHSFREFALGLNPLLAIPREGERWIPYYGYGAGVVRLSLGDNTELGGKVGGGYVRWNFFVDATVTIGEEEWVVRGELRK
jgi:hypothetical protein